MNKSVEGPGFFVISNDVPFELDLIKQALTLDPSLSNIVFVYSEREYISESYISSIRDLGKRFLLIPFEKYNEIEYASEVESLDLSRTVMIIKDLRHMLKRLDERLSMMQIKHVCRKKIIIDRYPYVVAPWKYYYPFSFFNKSLLGYSHSYAFEAALSNYFEGRIEEYPCDPKDMAQKTYACTFTSYKKLFNFRLEVEEYKVSDSERKEYERYRDSLFESEKSIFRVISLLHKYAASLMPGYNLPLSLRSLYKKTDKETLQVCRTDLKIDDYLYSEMVKLINDSNTLVAELYAS